MITLIHGEDTTASRNYYQLLKSQAENPVTFDGGSLTLTSLVQAIEGGGLFSEEKHIFIEDFFSKKNSEKITLEILSYLEKQPDSSVYFWEGKDISKKQFAGAKTIVNKQFKFPQTLFAFLDGIGRSRKQSIALFHEALAYTPAELIFFMMIRQFRLLLALSESSQDTIDEVKRLAPWQSGKLKKQTAFFTKDLQDLYKKLYDIDYALKTGQLSLNLTQAIDFFLAEI